MAAVVRAAMDHGEMARAMAADGRRADASGCWDVEHALMRATPALLPALDFPGRFQTPRRVSALHA
jgi:hypothetical protein